MEGFGSGLVGLLGSAIAHVWAEDRKYHDFNRDTSYPARQIILKHQVTYTGQDRQAHGGGSIRQNV